MIAILASLILLAHSTLAADPGPVCLVSIGDAVVANYGGEEAQAACSTFQARRGLQPNPRWSLECIFSDDPDFVQAFAYGHAWVVFDLSINGFSTAHDLCTNAVASGAVVTDANFQPYDAQNTP